MRMAKADRALPPHPGPLTLTRVAIVTIVIVIVGTNLHAGRIMIIGIMTSAALLDPAIDPLDIREDRSPPTPTPAPAPGSTLLATTATTTMVTAGMCDLVRLNQIPWLVRAGVCRTWLCLARWRRVSSSSRSAKRLSPTRLRSRRQQRRSMPPRRSGCASTTDTLAMTAMQEGGRQAFLHRFVIGHSARPQRLIVLEQRNAMVRQRLLHPLLLLARGWRCGRHQRKLHHRCVHGL